MLDLCVAAVKARPPVEADRWSIAPPPPRVGARPIPLAPRAPSMPIGPPSQGGSWRRVDRQSPPWPSSGSRPYTASS